MSRYVCDSSVCMCVMRTVTKVKKDVWIECEGVTFSGSVS